MSAEIQEGDKSYHLTQTYALLALKLQQNMKITYMMSINKLLLNNLNHF